VVEKNKGRRIPDCNFSLQIGLNYNIGLGSVGPGCVTQACDSSDNGKAATACTGRVVCGFEANGF
jgi:hypothetical protein